MSNASESSLTKKSSNASSKKSSQHSLPAHKESESSLTPSAEKTASQGEPEFVSSSSEDEEYEEAPEVPLKETLSSKIKGYIWPTLSDYGRKQLASDPLFQEILKHDNLDQFLSCKSEEEASILVTGFGLRNVESLENAINEDERRRLLKLYIRKLKEQRRLEKEERSRQLSTSSSGSSRLTKTSTADTISQTDVSTTKSDISQEKKHLEYLLGLESQLEGAAEGMGPPFAAVHPEESEEELQLSKSKNMRAAQKYLRTHRIFEFVNFLITHLLSANPDNPIEFLLNLLNQCLMYRSGLGNAPVLYDKRHIEQLFNLMDKMKSGFVDYAQYITAMNTLGICSYNKFPNTTSENLVSKEVFIEEIYEAEVELFEDLIKKRRRTDKQPVVVSYSTPSISQQSDQKPYFIPSELFKFRQKDTGGQAKRLTLDIEDWGE